MRKAAVMIGFGAFFLTMALLMRFYAYPKLAVIPADQNTQQVITDDHARYFDANTRQPDAGPIKTLTTVVADQEASKKASKDLGKGVIVLNEWQSTNSLKDMKAHKPPIDAFTERMAVDKSSGKAVAWSGNEINGQHVDIQGQTIKFPFHVDKGKSYDYFDTTLHKPIPMKYVGTEHVKGMKTYKYTQTIPLTKFRTQEVPGENFGLPRGGRVADRKYGNVRTIWVDPETGVMMKLQEKQHQTLTVPNAAPINAMTTTSTMNDATIQKNVDDYKTKSGQLKVLRLWAPIFLGLLGSVAILLGLVISVAAGRARRRGEGEGQGEGTYAENPDGGAHPVGAEGAQY